MRIATKGRHKVLTQNNVHSQGTCTGIFNFPNPTSPGSAQGLRFPKDQRDRGGGLIKPVAERCGREGGNGSAAARTAGTSGLPRTAGTRLPRSTAPGLGPREHLTPTTAHTGGPALPQGTPAAYPPRPGGHGHPAGEGAGTRPGPLGPRGRGLLPLGGAEGTRAWREAISPPLRSTNGSSYRRAGTLPNPRGPPQLPPRRLDPLLGPSPFPAASLKDGAEHTGNLSSPAAKMAGATASPPLASAR